MSECEISTTVRDETGEERHVSVSAGTMTDAIELYEYIKEDIQE